MYNEWHVFDETENNRAGSSSGSRMARILIPLLVSLTFASLAHGDAVSPQPNSKYRLPLEAIPTYYKLTLTVNMNDYTFSGIVQTNITATRNSRTITLNAKNLTINEVRMTNSSGEITNLNTTDLDDRYETLTINLNEDIVKGQWYLLKIAYNATLNDQLRGFYKSRSTNKDGKPT